MLNRFGVIFGLFLLVSCAFEHNAKKLPQSNVLDEFLNQWHLAASIADSASYFGKMSRDSRFLGTDASENWSKDAFCAYSMPHFRAEKTWDFTPSKRHWYYNADSTTAWFDESLDTWMGLCRGSGVIIIEDNEHKLAHYNLSVTVPNEKMDAFINLLKADSRALSIK